MSKFSTSSGFIAALFFCFTIGIAQTVQAQRTTAFSPYFIIVNGGLFGGSDYANVAIYDPLTALYTTIDTIYTTSVQHATWENDINDTYDFYLYVAAADSIVKYDLNSMNGQGPRRVAANAFGSVSTFRVATTPNEILVGNWYGSTANNLRIFDKTTLAYVDSIGELAKGTQDILIVGDTAYIGQNTNDFSSNYQDTLGYIAVVKISTRQWLYNDTLNASGFDLGRMVRLGDSIISVNPKSNTISYYNFRTRQSNTVAAPAGVQFEQLNTGNSIDLVPNLNVPFTFLSEALLPIGGVLARYDLVQNQMVRDSVIVHGQNTPFVAGFSYATNFFNDEVILNKINFIDQSQNRGFVYNMTTGDTLTSFPVGYSPEVVLMIPRYISSVERVAAKATAKVFPNPTADILEVQPALVGEQVIVLVNTMGQELLRQNCNGNTSVDLSAYPAGIYWLQVRPATKAMQAGATWQQVVKY
jgi:hypothetical protein